MLLKEYKKRESVIKNRLNEFSKVNEKDYFYELCFCLLTPGSKARQAEKVINYLKEIDFENKNVEVGDQIRQVRFHNNKRQRLYEMKEKYALILERIKSENDSLKLRNFLAENVKGIGYKEASHFLRNIGRKNLVILDRHILKNMVKYNALGEFPKSLSKNKYFQIEAKFKELAEKNNLTVDELDLLFWSFETGEVFK